MAEQCPVCKHFRYDDDPFDESCFFCVQWACDQISNARREVSALRSRYCGDLTDEQIKAFDYKWVMNGDNLPGIDAEIRRVREG